MNTNTLSSLSSHSVIPAKAGIQTKRNSFPHHCKEQISSPVIARSVSDEAISKRHILSSPLSFSPSPLSFPQKRESIQSNNPKADRSFYLGKRSFHNSLKFAIEGLKFAFKTQTNLRIHILIGSLVIILGLALGVSSLEMIILSLVVTSVIACELINTAVEVSLDLVNGNKFNPLVKIVKDVVAAAVLLASINALVVGAVLFSKYILL